MVALVVLEVALDTREQVVQVQLVREIAAQLATVVSAIGEVAAVGPVLLVLQALQALTLVKAAMACPAALPVHRSCTEAVVVLVLAVEQVRAPAD